MRTVLPSGGAGSPGWLDVVKQLKAMSIDREAWQAHSKFARLISTKPTTGDAQPPPDVVEALAINQLIQDKNGVRVVGTARRSPPTRSTVSSGAGGGVSNSSIAASTVVQPFASAAGTMTTGGATSASSSSAEAASTASAASAVPNTQNDEAITRSLAPSAFALVRTAAADDDDDYDDE
jgi:hypothetical protein